MRGVRQNFLSRFFFAPSLIEGGVSEGEGVGDGEWDIGLVWKFVGGERCREALKTGGSRIPFNRRSFYSILSFSRCSLSTTLSS